MGQALGLVRDLNTIDSELRLLAARCAGRCASMVASRRVELLDERLAHSQFLAGRWYKGNY
jgi:hypothetical protein